MLTQAETVTTFNYLSLLYRTVHNQAYAFLLVENKNQSSMGSSAHSSHVHIATTGNLSSISAPLIVTSSAFFSVSNYKFRKACATFLDILSWIGSCVSGISNFVFVIVSNRNMYRQASSETSSSGASGRTLSSYGLQLFLNHSLKNSLSTFSGSRPDLNLSSYELAIQYLLESGVCTCLLERRVSS